MTNDRFLEEVEKQIFRCKRTLTGRADHYQSSSDRLVQFKKAAKVLDCHPTVALNGLLIKHTIKLHDMLERNIDLDCTTKQWNEVITDIINYLFLLKALLVEEDGKEEDE